MERDRIMLAEGLQTRLACRWQGAEMADLGPAKLVKVPVPNGNVLTEVQAQPDQRRELLQLARQYRAQVMITPATTPRGLERYLRWNGFSRNRSSLILGCQRDQVRDLARPGVAVRPVTEAEIPAWHRVFTTAFSLPAGMISSAEDSSRQAFRRMADSSRWFLGSLDGEDAGCCVLYTEGELGLLLAVGTVPQARRRGVAATVLSHALRTWREAGGAWLFLETGPDNVARQLYRKAGFRAGYRRVSMLEARSLSGLHA